MINLDRLIAQISFVPTFGWANTVNMLVEKVVIVVRGEGHGRGSRYHDFHF